MCGISAVFELKGGNVNARGVDNGCAKLAAKLDRKLFNLMSLHKGWIVTDTTWRQGVSKRSAIVDLMRKAYGSLTTDV